MLCLAAITIITPLDIFSEEDDQWNELRKWKKIPDDKIPVLIVRDAKVSQNQVDIVENAINSKEVKNSRTLFLGWNEGIKEISKSFGVKVPTLEIQYKLESVEAITIHLKDKSSSNNYNGYTNLFYDKNGNIQRAMITIYNTDELNKIEVESIIRHELGHALGLGHTNKENDLMQPKININYNLISFLDLKTLANIY
ncbi:matrixin family metalloprotease [Nitrosopumilus sp.]|uniref:matrixin family metalloprotease n=1 Tax=Nitrosopumilus sp. TaxID=2024843 RepID=UPI002624BF38|nr:matrixin family metalloprotease [Nitrosopumilus sp.]